MMPRREKYVRARCSGRLEPFPRAVEIGEERIDL
jgi:hypothetical protein